MDTFTAWQWYPLEEAYKVTFNLWLLTKRALSWFDPNFQPKYYIRWGGVRLLFLITCFVWGWSAAKMVRDDKDFEIPYPLQKDS